jgi:hypothetical protein
MSMPSRRSGSRALRPQPEQLEGRQLLSKLVTGMDIDGDTFTLKLEGAGDLRVIKQNGADGNPQSLDSMSQINMIEVAGANPNKTRLIGQVTKGPLGDGRVFFNEFNEIGGRSVSLPGSNGIRVIDIEGFWLGNTFPNTTASSQVTAPSINIPDGVVTMRFGGADATFNIPSTSTTANTLTVNLGLPLTTGTSIIADKIISGARPGSTTTSPPLQDSVTFSVAGRLNLFQANEIDGNSSFPPTGFLGGGGTIVISAPEPQSLITGQIGDVRIGGNATNFAVQTNDKISNYYVGGEANNVFVLSPGGARNLYFGKGLDTVIIDAHTIENLEANRDAVNSFVSVERSMGRIVIGGDVVNTQVLSGYQLNLSQEFSSQTAPTTMPSAQDGGGMTVLIAGDVTDSVFAASVEPFLGTFGTSNDLNIPHAHIDAKVEGFIDNSFATPDSPNTAFFAQKVHLAHGPVIPPVVPEAPFGPTVYHRGQHGLAGPNALKPKHQTSTQAARRARSRTPSNS